MRSGETVGSWDQIVEAPPRTVFQCSLDIRVAGGEREAVSCLEIVLTELEKLSTLSDPGGGGGGGGTEAGVVGRGDDDDLGGGGGGGGGGSGDDDDDGGGVGDEGTDNDDHHFNHHID